MAPQTTNGKVAAEIALFPLRENEGPRIGVLGDSGSGKTEAMRRLTQMYLEKVPRGIAYVIDDKKPTAQFFGQERIDAADLEQRPMTKESRVVVFRGRPFESLEVDPETIAVMQRKLSMIGRPSVVVYDELDKAANMAMWREGDYSVVRWAFIKGRDLGASSIWGTQETQAVPREAFNQSSCIFCFRLVGNPLRLLKERGYLEGGAEAIIPTLPCDDLPRNQRGYFVLLRRGKPWDGKIYRFE